MCVVFHFHGFLNCFPSIESEKLDGGAAVGEVFVAWARTKAHSLRGQFERACERLSPGPTRGADLEQKRSLKGTHNPGDSGIEMKKWV